MDLHALARGRAMPGPPRTWWRDAVVLLALVGLLATVTSLGHAMWAPWAPETAAAFDLSPARLPYYAARSLLRMLLALGASVFFTLVVGSWAARSRHAARLILPVLDIMQSVPILGFLSATVTFFVALTPGRLLGLELASIFAIFTSQVWNLTFAYYQVLVGLPREESEAVRLYRLTGWQRFTHFELPSAVIPLVWNGMMSFGGGWFFLAASEAITVLHREFLLPGLGSYVALAVRHRDLPALTWALGAMAALIVLVDRVFWRPLVAWSEKFRFEQSQAESGVPRSGVLDLLRRSRTVPWLEARLAQADEALDRVWRRWQRPEGAAGPTRTEWLDRAVTLGLWTLLGLLAVRGTAFVATRVAWSEAFLVVGYGLATLARVAVVVAVSTLVWTPVGVWIGLNPRVCRPAQPLVLILASFPANFLFPLATMALLGLHVSLNWGAVGLMALGAQWYVLFNAIAGAMAIPNDLREMAQDLGLRGRTLWGTLILPALFPAWVIGALTAAGGAWNASIVAEVVSWGDTTLSAAGLGAYITAATAAGDWPRIALGVATMSAFVATLNRLVWRPLGRLAEERFRLG